ncbi:NAD(P)H-dependent flavin oxidoreductase [Paracoccus sp. p3-h83]|uniref:NAD(P)H-dependent flavin oxidoreductase n=1 Tax=Paracoccus sp. p3-h83 TaxID=3342805 RepID=UPI0035BB1074
MKLTDLGLIHPIWQAPMAGVATPALAAAVDAAGGLGGLGLGAMSADQARAAMAEARARGARHLHVNLFCHVAPARDPAIEATWLERLAPDFTALHATPPDHLTAPYTSLRDDPAMLAAVIEARPDVISFHFGLPHPDQLAALRATGALLAVSVTSRAEALIARQAGVDLVIAQGWQAGGHRGIFDENGPDARLSTLELLAELTDLDLPCIAAGGITTPADLRAARAAGAVAVQAGTAFLATPEAATDAGHRAALAGGQTVMTRAISGRPARSLVNRITAHDDAQAPAYPLTYSAGKALIAAAARAGQPGYGAHWAGVGAAQAQAVSAARVVALLAG